MIEIKKTTLCQEDLESVKKTGRIIDFLKKRTPLSEGDLMALNSLFTGGSNTASQTSYVFFKGTAGRTRDMKAKDGRVIKSKKSPDPKKFGIYRITPYGGSSIIECDSIDELLFSLNREYSDGIIEITIISS